MAKSKLFFLLTKLSVRLVVILTVFVTSVVLSVLMLSIPFDTSLLVFALVGLLYLVFWFALCFWIVTLRQNSNFNALALLFVWLLMLILLPASINNYITNKYPVPEAFATIIHQRDSYHKKWDTNKKKTLETFYAEYPQFAHYGYPPEKGFHWGWYYAMQHLGDVGSRQVSQAMEHKTTLREQLSRKWSMVIPSMHAQTAFNDIAETGLMNHRNFIDYIEAFHEKTRLYFYPKIFDGAKVEDVDWNRFVPQYFSAKEEINWKTILLPQSISIALFILLSIFSVKRKLI